MENLEQYITQLVDKTVQAILSQYSSKNIPWPSVERTKDASKGDFCLMLVKVAAIEKVSPKDFSALVATHCQKFLESNPSKLVKKVENVGVYLNIFVDHAPLYKLAITEVLKLGDSYGKLSVKKGSKVIIEHTSSNPNGPLHIGNLRNVILGGVLAKILQSVGYDVKQFFYVNDLGFQIGLTAIGYESLGDKLELLKGSTKSDQFIGRIYAIMNTFHELQGLGFQPLQIDEMIAANEEPSLPEKGKNEKLTEYISIYKNLKELYPDLVSALLGTCKGITNIKEATGSLNLKYEHKDPEAIKIYRKMVGECLAGVQQTLDIYNIKHDKFDYESELGWEGLTDKVLNTIKASPYFVPQTQCNDKGLPEGAYFNLEKFIKDNNIGIKIPKFGYPHLYVLRPDGSTLYTFRDIVYSLKKEDQADMVLNVIASEQNVAQEKVALVLELLHPGKRKQFHVSYELVKLMKNEKEFKMSSRRGIYELADSLYDALKAKIQSLIDARAQKKGEKIDPQDALVAIHELSTASMKYALISSSTSNLISFDVDKVTNIKDGSAPFLLYNSTRFYSIFRKFDKGVEAGSYPPLPPIDEIDWTLLTEQFEWELLLDYVLHFPRLLFKIACPNVPIFPGNPEFPIHLLCDFLVSLVRLFSKYWAGTKILKENPTSQEAKEMHARLYLLKAVQVILNNGLQMLTMKPLQKM